MTCISTFFKIHLFFVFVGHWSEEWLWWWFVYCGQADGTFVDFRLMAVWKRRNGFFLFLRTSPRFGVIFDTVSIKVRWEQSCRWNCDLRVINAWKAFSVVPKASPWHWKSCAHMRITSLWGVTAKWLVAPQGYQLGKNYSSKLQRWSFYFPNLSLFVSSYVKIKKFCLF